MIGNADIEKAIQVIWDAHLHPAFAANWGSDTDHESLHDEEAEPGFEGPYCNYELGRGTTEHRMTKATESEGRQEIRSVPLEFRVFVKQTPDTPKSARQLASDLAGSIIEVFGGHPNVKPKTPTLDNGSVIQMQYQNDFGMRVGEAEHSWRINYSILVDVPVAA